MPGVWVWDAARASPDSEMPTSGDLKSGESISYSTPLPESQVTGSTPIIECANVFI